MTLHFEDLTPEAKAAHYAKINREIDKQLAEAPEMCPDCGKKSVVRAPGGVVCTIPKCGYWFCC